MHGLSHAGMVMRSGFDPGLRSSGIALFLEVTDEVRRENDFIPC